MFITKNRIAVEKWFCERVDISDLCRIVAYKCCASNYGGINYNCREAYTKNIDLLVSVDEIIGNISKKCLKKIKSVQDETEFEEYTDLDNFISTYNEYADNKGISKLTVRLKNYTNNIVMTVAKRNSIMQAIHLYLVDRECGRARLYRAMTLFKADDDSAKKNFAGAAKRALVLHDILHFKNSGFSVYDLGGYAYETNDDKLKNINAYKDEFGGTLVKEYDFISYPLYIINILSRNSLRSTNNSIGTGLTKELNYNI